MRKKGHDRVAEKLKEFELRQAARALKRARSEKQREYAREHMEMKRSFKGE
jgi:hypothetical protein